MPLPKPETLTGVYRSVPLPSPTCTQKQNLVRNKCIPTIPRNIQQQPSKKRNIKHHLAIVVPSPARHRPAARQRTGMTLHTTASKTPAHLSITIPHPVSHILISHHHNSAINQMNRCRFHTTNGRKAITVNLTLPKAIITIPLSKPETLTGVLRPVVLPSPTCTKITPRHQQSRTPPKLSTVRKYKTTSITWPI